MSLYKSGEGVERRKEREREENTGEQRKEGRKRNSSGTEHKQRTIRKDIVTMFFFYLILII